MEDEGFRSSTGPFYHIGDPGAKTLVFENVKDLQLRHSLRATKALSMPNILMPGLQTESQRSLGRLTPHRAL